MVAVRRRLRWSATTGRHPRGSVRFGLTLAVTGCVVISAGPPSASSAPPPAYPPRAVTAPAPSPSRPAPRNPSDTQLTNAAAVKLQAAGDVGRLSGLIAAVNTRITGLGDNAELAKEHYLHALNQLAAAKLAARTTQQAVFTAGDNVAVARASFRLTLAASYMNRTSGAGSMLTAPDPTVLLQRDQLNRYIALKQGAGIADLNRATVSKANADAAARGAVANSVTANTVAAAAAQTAVTAEANARIQRTRLARQRTRYQGLLQAAGERLTGLTDKRAAYVAWQQAEARRQALEAARRAAERRQLLAAQERERTRLLAIARQQAANQRAADQRATSQRAADQHAADQRAADQRAADQHAADQRAADQRAADQRAADQRAADQRAADQQTADQRAADQRAADQRAADQRAADQRAPRRRARTSSPTNAPSSDAQPNSQPSNSGSNPSGSGTSGWTPACGQAAATRAMRWVGTPYSFAAGNAAGPTWGACVTNDAGWNDCHVFGFDCSGLTLYAWAAQGVALDHFSETQFSQGSVHPSIDQLQPGDLLFWSSNGQTSGIHHVAIYISNGDVVEAPQSGDVVKVVPMWSSGYLGATRPGT